MQPFELRGDGVLLAVPTVDDIERITECCQDPEIQRWVTSIPVPYTRADAERFVSDLVVAGWRDESSLVWAIRNPADQRILGMISLAQQGDGLANIGFWLVPEARGRHVMSSAVRLVVEYAFDADRPRLKYLRWFAIAGNWASRRVAWATGFTFHDMLPGDHPTREGRRDKWIATLRAGDPMKPKTPWYDVPEIRGETVTLRPFADSDADAVVEACNDPISRHWLSALPAPYTHDHAVQFIETRRADPAAGKAVHWAVTWRDGGPARGAFSLMDLDERSGGAEVGYWVHPAARGKGVATEAVGLMLRHAFGDERDGGLGLRRVLVAHVVGNESSRAPIERNGFKPIGIERGEHRFRDGTIGDLQWYDLLLDEFRPNK